MPVTCVSRRSVIGICFILEALLRDVGSILLLDTFVPMLILLIGASRYLARYEFIG